MMKRITGSSLKATNKIFAFCLVAVFSTSTWAADDSRNCRDLLAPGEWKLIRDRLPEIYVAEGDPSEVVRATPEEVKLLLIEKVKEELAEFAKDPSPEELGDLLDVVYALQDHYGLDPKLVEEIRQQKLERKGGFTEGFALKIDKK